MIDYKQVCQLHEHLLGGAGVGRSYRQDDYLNVNLAPVPLKMPDMSPSL